MIGTIRNIQPRVKAEAFPSFAFVGKTLSGKNTYADELRLQIQDEFGVEAYRFSLSAKIIEIARDLFAMKDKDRMLLQTIATKMKEIDPEVWGRYIAREALKNGKLPLIADGMRSPDEARPFRENLPNLVIVRIEVDEGQRLDVYRERYGRYPTPKELDSIMERTIADIHADVILTNNYQMAELRSQVRGLVSRIKVTEAAEVLRPN